MSESATPSATTPLSSAQRRQIVWLSLGAVAVFAFFRVLPTGTNLSHGDFRLEGGNVLEFCDPAAPQFLPVTTARSPVELTVSPVSAIQGQETSFTFQLRTSTGKTIGPVDLLVAHTRKLHLMAVDSTLTDYQHVHPESVTGEPGAWRVAFTPQQSGNYRVFADFTPTATARGLYASVDLQVAAANVDPHVAARVGTLDQESVVSVFPITRTKGGHRFELDAEDGVIRAREPTELTLSFQREDGDIVQLGEVMGAFAHLVAFDRDRSGFAHLHPRETDLDQKPDARNPELHFQVTIPAAGEYVIWAQMVLDGREIFVPFWFEVMP